MGWRISDLAREFGLSRTNVYKELASPGPRQRPAALNEAQLVHVERRLGVCPAIQRQLRLLRPAVVRDPEIRFETDPGLQTQADWATFGLWPFGDQMGFRSTDQCKTQQLGSGHRGVRRGGERRCRGRCGEPS